MDLQLPIGSDPDFSYTICTRGAYHRVGVSLLGFAQFSAVSFTLITRSWGNCWRKLWRVYILSFLLVEKTSGLHNLHSTILNFLLCYVCYMKLIHVFVWLPLYSFFSVLLVLFLIEEFYFCPFACHFCVPLQVMIYLRLSSLPEIVVFLIVNQYLVIVCLISIILFQISQYVDASK